MCLRAVKPIATTIFPVSFSVTTSSEADGMIRALSEANMATEAGMIVLDVLSVYTDKFKVCALF